jgi:signal transduction histidine kinase/ActR/RegA family two-component response regulator
MMREGIGGGPGPGGLRAFATRAFGAVTRARLSFKLIFFETLLIALVVGAAFFVLNMEIRATTQRFFVTQLRRSQTELLTLQNRSLEQLVWTSSVITENPTLRAAIETYRLESAAGRGRRVELLATVQRETEKIAAGLGKDLLIITDDRGRVLAASERHGARPRVGADLLLLPVVHRALDSSLPTDASNFGVAEVAGDYFQIGCVPIVLQGFPIGALILGERLDPAFVGGLRELFGGEVVIARHGEVISSTLAPSPEGQRTGTVLAAGSGQGGTIRLGGDEFVMASLPLGPDPAGEPVMLYLLHPLSAALGPVNHVLRLSFLVYGCLAVLLAGIGAALVSRSLLAPLRSFVGFMESVAESREYSRRFDSSTATVEIRTLDASYDRLIESLAFQHAELQQRTEELSRTNETLTEQMRERERAEEALTSSEQQLRQSQKLEAVGTLAGGVAHDFNNLLTVILSYTAMVMEELGPRSPLYEDLKSVHEAGLRAAGLTKQLLAFSRKQVMQPKVLDLNDTVTGIEKMLRRVIGEDIDLQTVTHASPGLVQADPGQLEQVIMNLVVNARDAMPRGGRMTLQTENVHFAPGAPELLAPMPAGDWVLLAVSDTGSGMDEATRVRIFEPFFTTKEPGKGTGLGLSTVYGIIKQSGGFIWVESEPGQGTTFKIYLPQAADTDEPVVRTSEPARLSVGAETILLAEDEEPVRLLARRCLEGMGYRVLAASRADEAVRVAAHHAGPIHLLLADVVMPGGSGSELAERLAAQHPEMRVLYMSGYTDDAIVHRGVIAPGIELLEKPFNPATLARKVREVLDKPGTAAAVAAS